MWPRLQLLVIAAVSVGAGCTTEAFQCQTDDACDAGGSCEPTGWCSFPDPDCESGKRYGDFAGGGLAGQCVVPNGGGSTGGEVSTTSTMTTTATTTTTTTTTTSTSSETGQTSGGMVCAEGWWDCGWQRRRALAIDTSVGGESLTDVPLFVGIDPQNTTLQALGGVDYRLVDDAGDVLDHELVVDAQGQVIGIWFRLPTYGDGAPTVRLYYENAEAEDGQNPAGVWQNGYVGVWHLDGTLAESITGTPITVEDATLVDGVTGSAYSFDGMTGAVVAPLDPNLDDVFSSGGSVEAWFRSVDAGQNGFGRIVDKGGGPPTTAGFGLYLEGASDPRLRMSRGIESGAKFYNSATGVLTHGAWTHICLSYDDSDIEVAPVVEADGEPLTMTVANALMGATVTDAMHSLFIGNAETRNRTFHGELDEIRVSRTVRSEAWGRVQALGSRGMLVTVGDDELQG